MTISGKCDAGDNRVFVLKGGGGVNPDFFVVDNLLTFHKLKKIWAYLFYFLSYENSKWLIFTYLLLVFSSSQILFIKMEQIMVVSRLLHNTDYLNPVFKEMRQL